MVPASVTSRPRRGHATLDGRTAEEKEEIIIECLVSGCGFKTHKKMRFQATHEMESHHELFHAVGKDGRYESEDGRRVQDSRRDGLAQSIKLDRTFGASGEQQMLREQYFIETYGAEVFRKLVGEVVVPAVPVARRRKPTPTETSAAGGNSSLSSRNTLSRVAKGRKAQDDGDNVTKTCKFCGVVSYSLPEQDAQAWMANHQKTSDACLQMQAGEIELEFDTMIADRKKRSREKQQKSEIEAHKAKGGGFWNCDEWGCSFQLCVPLAGGDFQLFRRSKGAHVGHHNRVGGGGGVGLGGEGDSVWEDVEDGGGDEGDGDVGERMEAEVQGFEEHDKFNVEYLTYIPLELHKGSHAADFMDAYPFGNSADEDDSVEVAPGLDGAAEAAASYPTPKRTLVDCDQTIFNHQKKIEEILHEPLRGTRGFKNKTLILEIYALGLALDVSDAGGKLLLGFLNKHLTLEDDAGSVFTTWTGLKASIARNVKKECPVQCLSIPLPVEYFGLTDLRGKPLNSTKCWHYPLLQRLGEACLNVKPEHFCKEARLETIEGSFERIYSDFSTGLLFQGICKFVLDIHGVGVVPLVVGFFHDEAAATNSRSAQPLVMFILNVILESFRPIYLAFIPLDLPYTDAYLTKVLQNQKKKPSSAAPQPKRARSSAAETRLKQSRRKQSKKQIAKRLVADIIRFSKTAVMFQLLEHIIRPAVNSKPYRIQIGMRGLGPVEEIVASLQVGNFNGDSKALHKQGSCRMGFCRWCTCTNVVAFGSKTHAYPVRNSKFMDMLTSALGEFTLDDFKKYCGNFPEMNTAERRSYLERRKAILKIGNLHGAVPGFNILLSTLFKPLEERGVWWFFMSLSVDIIHTIWKGLCEYVISWSLQIVLAISKNSKMLTGSDNYSNALSLLDQRISEYTGCHESLQPVQQVKMSALSTLLKSTGKNRSSMKHATGIMTGSIPAWQLPGIVLQLLLCIGTEGDIVPNVDCAFQVPGGDAHTINVNAVFTSAFATVLEVAYYCEADRLTETQLGAFSKCIDNAHNSVLALFSLKARIRNQEAAVIAQRKREKEEKKKQKERAVAVEEREAVLQIRNEDEPDEESDDVDDEDEFPTVIKLHLTSHLPTQIRWLGANSRTFNASHGERSHQENVTWAFSKSSRNFISTHPEMCSAILTREMGRMMGKLEEDIEGPPEKDSKMPAHELVFETMPTLGSVKLRVSETQVLERSDEKNERIRFLHSLCTLTELFDVIKGKYSFSKGKEKDVEACDFVDWYMAFTRGKEGADLRLVGGVKCLGDASVGYKPCTFRANSLYKGRGSTETSSVFSSVQVNYDASSCNSFGKIMTIAVLRWQSEREGGDKVKERIFVIVARYEIITKGRTSAKMPLEEYRLAANKSRTGGLKLDMISVSAIIPCFMQITQRDLVLQEATVHTFSKMTWFCIPMSRCVKVDNSSYETFVATLPSDVFKTSDEIDEASDALGLVATSLPQDHLSLPGSRNRRSSSSSSESGSGSGSDSESDY